MEKLIFPGHIAKLDYIIPALQVYVEAGDWVKTADYIEREFAILKANGVESEMKGDKTDYTKDAELPRYFGFVERQIPGDIKSDCRITNLGKRFYDAVNNNNQDEINESLMIAFETITFGKNNDGCPGSNTRLEAPNILLIASLMLNGVSRQEYAGILYEMLYNNAPIVNALLKIKLCREKNVTIANKVRVDNKIIPFLVNLDFLLEDGSFIKLTPRVKEVYQERITKLPTTNNLENIFPTEMDKTNFNDEPSQIIFYGAPGTGKSHKIEDDTEGESVIRTTFHPDSDYSTFVGAYKPCMEQTDMKVVPVVMNNGINLNKNEGTFTENKISYRFVKQAFLKAYLGAWKKMTDNPSTPRPQFLIIEEINRGNCAQIFGDLFQLLDRGDNGYSSYTIDADTDMQKAIAEAFKNEDEFKLENKIDASEADIKYTSNYAGSTLSNDIQEGRVLLLPKNLYIWATMNTSDQSLFPIDSAFKRRWEWVYMPIKDHKDKDYKIEIEDTTYDWWGFLEKINSVINTVTNSEDKKLGYFFVKTDKKINAKKFVGKVLFYLWNDVFKNYGFDNPIFNKEDKNKYVFSDFFQKDGSPETDNIKRFLKSLDETIDKENPFTEKKPEEAASTSGNNNPGLFANQE